MKDKKMLMHIWNQKTKTVKLRLVNDSSYGSQEGGEIMVNVEKIHQESKNEKQFVKEFSLTIQHEMVHFLLDKISGIGKVKEFSEVGEEKAVRMMCNEPWNEEIVQKYLEGT